ncbi:MAG: hypothetical protein HW391_38, partial [Chloroflexi bacterium]|nr:hypothetical protein [Chloroflexota bacterium]
DGSTGGSTGSTNGSTDGGASGGNPPTQEVLGEVAVGPTFELPATDTVSDVVTGGSYLMIILGLAGLACAAVLLAPTRRREAEATE